MSKLTAGEDKLLMRGFDYATDSNGYDPSWDDADVLKYLTDNSGETVATRIARAINIPVHRVIAARNRLEAAGKFPVNPPPSVVVNFPDCSKGIGSCVNERNATTGMLVSILDSEGLWKIDSFKDGHAKLDLIEGDHHLPKRRRVALCKLRIAETETCSKGNIESEPVTTTEPLTVITLWQPWATFIIKGIKTYETRSWATNYRGKILIHAAKRPINWDELDIESLEETHPDVRAWDYPLGAIVGEASLESCTAATYNGLDEVEKICGNFETGRFAWEMRNVKPLLIPDVKGKQGLWKYEPSVNSDVVLGEMLQGDEPETKCEQSQNILLTEPPRQVEANSQLSIFFDSSEEPPDPDDYPDNYEEVYGQWAANHPEIAQAIEKGKNRVEVGDHVQLVVDLRRIGEVRSVNSKAITVRYCDGFEFSHSNEEGVFNLFSKANSDAVLGESFFKVGERVKTSAPGHEEKIFTVNAIHSTGMIGVTLNENLLSFPANWLEHHIEEIKVIESKPVEETVKKKRPPKGCGTGYLSVREANKKRNAAKGRDPDIYYVYCYSYTDLWGKEIKSSISVPRDKVSRVKSMIESKEHYVKICKFLGKSVGCWY